MAARAALGEHLLLRPLLGCSRQTLESYAQRHALTWIDDDSNQDTRFDRNFLRLQVLPQLNQRWPHFASAVARSAGLCAEQEQLLDELLAEPLQNLLAADRSLAIDGLTDCSPVRRFALLRRWIALFNVAMPAREQLQRLWEEVALSREDAEPQLQLGTYQIRRFRGRLHLLPPLAALRDVHLPWQPDEPLALPDGLGWLVAGEGRAGAACAAAIAADQHSFRRRAGHGTHRGARPFAADKNCGRSWVFRPGSVNASR